MVENQQLISIGATGRIGDFKVEPENVLSLAGVALYEPGKGGTREAPAKIDEGELNISKNGLNFTGSSNNVSFPLRDITRVQPYENAIDIYEKGRKAVYKFGWGNKINMRLAGITGDDGKIKPLEGRIVAQFIINERNRVWNLIKSK